MAKGKLYWSRYVRYLELYDRASHGPLNEADAKEIAQLQKSLNDDKPEVPTPPTSTGIMAVPKTPISQINIPRPTESIPSGLAAPSPTPGGSASSPFDAPVLRHNIPDYKVPLIPFSEEHKKNLQGMEGKNKKSWDWQASLKKFRDVVGKPGGLEEWTRDNEKLGGMKGQAKAAIGQGVAALQTAPSSPLGGMAGGMNAIGSALGAAGLGPIGALVKLGAVAVEGVEKLKRWNQQVHEANIQFADFSAPMSAVRAEQEVRDIRLSKMKGDELAASAKGQAEAKSRLEQATAPWEIAIQKMTNNISESFSDVVSSIIETITPDFLKGHEEGKGGGLGAEMAEAGQVSWAAMYGRPIHLGVPDAGWQRRMFGG